VAGHVTETLRDLGWRAADDGELPRTSGLPAAGVLVALQQEVAT
jgi:hypothetical protein